jgi:hypothetical protein
MGEFYMPPKTDCQHFHSLKNSLLIFRSCKDDTMLVPCVAIIDEDDNDNNDVDWLEFRANYPDRPFCLLIPYDGHNGVGIPSAASSDPKFQVHNVTRDEGNLPADNWFNLCGLGKLTLSNVQFVGLFVDESGSMDKRTVANSYSKFLADIEAANLKTCEVHDGREDWITPFITTITPVGGQCEEAKSASTRSLSPSLNPRLMSHAIGENCTSSWMWFGF